MKAVPRREAATGRPPPLRVTEASVSANSTDDFLEWLPPELQRSIARQIAEIGMQSGETGLPLIADALARSLSIANDSIGEARNLKELRATLAARDLIRDSMNNALREGIFFDFLKLYEEALARHSDRAIDAAIDDVPAGTLLGLYLSLAGNGNREPETAREQMLALGKAFGIGVRQLNLGAIYYGTENGLFGEREFGLTPALKAQAGRLGPGPEKDFALVDPNYFDMLRRLEAIPQAVEGDWGSLHPLVGGYAQRYRWDPWVREQGVERIERAVREVEDFVIGPRH